MEMNQNDLIDLKKSKLLFENLSLTAKITNLIGMPIGKGFELLPDNWNAKIGEVTQLALTKAAHTAIFTLKNAPCKESSNIWHKLAVATTGGIGGFFGLAALAIELPISTTIMLRSIADIARSEGEDLFADKAKLACIEVFALGAPTTKDDASKSGYFATRAALTHTVSEATKYITEKGVVEKGAPTLIRYIIQVAERFSIQVSEKAAAQALPAIGAAGGAIINTMFIDHFQDMARGHFITRRLERKYGPDIIRATYDKL